MASSLINSPSIPKDLRPSPPRNEKNTRNPSHWKEITSDPNAKEAIDFRKDQLRAALRPAITDRIAYLTDLARGKRVLDVGVVDHFAGAEEKTRWLHGHIASTAAYCLGVDVLAEPVAKLQSQGYNVRCCDITVDPDAIKERFDLIICGEVIEHLGSPQNLFAAASQLLVPGGRLLLTTPNPYYLARMVRFAFGRYTDSVDHVSLLFPGGIAEMAEREGLRLASYAGVRIPYRNFKSLFGRLSILFRPLLLRLGIVYTSFCETMIYECVVPARSRET